MAMAANYEQETNEWPQYYGSTDTIGSFTSGLSTGSGSTISARQVYDWNSWSTYMSAQQVYDHSNDSIASREGLELNQINNSTAPVAMHEQVTFPPDLIEYSSLQQSATMRLWRPPIYGKRPVKSRSDLPRLVKAFNPPQENEMLLENTNCFEQTKIENGQWGEVEDLSVMPGKDCGERGNIIMKNAVIPIEQLASKDDKRWNSITLCQRALRLFWSWTQSYYCRIAIAIIGQIMAIVCAPWFRFTKFVATKMPTRSKRGMKLDLRSAGGFNIFLQYFPYISRNAHKILDKCLTALLIGIFAVAVANFLGDPQTLLSALANSMPEIF